MILRAGPLRVQDKLMDGSNSAKLRFPPDRLSHCGVVVLLALCGGCAELPIPSYRFAEPSLARRTPSVQLTTPGATRQASETAPPAVESLPPVTAAPGGSPSQPPQAAGCDLPAPAEQVAVVGEPVACPPLIRWPHLPGPGLVLPVLPWPHCLCGLCGQGLISEPGLASDVPAPYGRFHSVPTQPVFAPRLEYGPPERLLQPAPRPHTIISRPPSPMPLPEDLGAAPLPGEDAAEMRVGDPQHLPRPESF